MAGKPAVSVLNAYTYEDSRTLRIHTQAEQRGLFARDCDARTLQKALTKCPAVAGRSNQQVGGAPIGGMSRLIINAER